MSQPSESITTVSGRRCTRTRVRAALASPSSIASSISPPSASLSLSSSIIPLPTAASPPPPSPRPFPQSPVAASPSSAVPLPGPSPIPTTLQALPSAPAPNGPANGQPSPDPLLPTPPPVQIQNVNPDGAPPSPSPPPPSPPPPPPPVSAAAVDVPVVSSAIAPAFAPLPSPLPSPSSVLNAVPDSILPSPAVEVSTPVLAISEGLVATSASAPLSATPSEQLDAVASPTTLPLPSEIPSGVSTGNTGPPALPTTTPAATDMSSSMQGNDISSASPSSGPPLAPIIGGVISGLIGVALIGFAIYFCTRRRHQIHDILADWRRRWRERDEEDSEKPSSPNQLESGPISRRQRFKRFFVQVTPPAPVYTREPAVQSPSTEGNRARAKSEWLERDMGSIFSTTGIHSGPSAMSPASPMTPRQAGLLVPVFGKIRQVRERLGLAPNRDSSGTSISPFEHVVEDPLVRRNSDPFRDPERPPRLRLTNPDSPGALSSTNSPMRYLLAAVTPPGMLTPKVVTTATMVAPSRAKMVSIGDHEKKPENPFADPAMSDLEEARSTPEWLRHPASHTRNPSAIQALNSHPPSPSDEHASGQISTSIDRRPASSHYFNISPIAPSSSFMPPLNLANPFLDNTPVDYPDRPRRNSSMYSTRPLGRDTSYTNSTLLSNEPGPSRPLTVVSPIEPLTIRRGNLGGPPTARSNPRISRATRGISDPFDLDRPEILNFNTASSMGVPTPSTYDINSHGVSYGVVPGRKSVRVSNARRDHYRRSSTPNAPTMMPQQQQQQSPPWTHERRASVVGTWTSWRASYREPSYVSDVEGMGVAR